MNAPLCSRGGSSAVPHSEESAAHSSKFLQVQIFEARLLPAVFAL